MDRVNDDIDRLPCKPQAHDVGIRYKYRATVGSCVREFTFQHDAEAWVVKRKRALSLIPAALLLTPSQRAVIVSRLESVESAQFGTCLASGFSGRKPCISYDGMRTWIAYDKDGYSLLPCVSTITKIDA